MKITKTEIRFAKIETITANNTNGAVYATWSVYRADTLDEAVRQLEAATGQRETSRLSPVDAPDHLGRVTLDDGSVFGIQ